MSVRLEILKSAAQAIRSDLSDWGVSQRQAAKQLGIAISTLNSFLNCEYNTQHRATLEKLLNSKIWSGPTRDKLQTLLDYEQLAFGGALARSRFTVVEGGRARGS